MTRPTTCWPSAYLDEDAILPLIRTGWGAVPVRSTHAEAFLRARPSGAPTSRYGR